MWICRPKGHLSLCAAKRFSSVKIRNGWTSLWKSLLKALSKSCSSKATVRILQKGIMMPRPSTILPPTLSYRAGQMWPKEGRAHFSWRQSAVFPLQNLLKRIISLLLVTSITQKKLESWRKEHLPKHIWLDSWEWVSVCLDIQVRVERNHLHFSSRLGGERSP